MSTVSENNKRIAKNTGMLYVRMLLIMLVTLYTSRVVLNELGIDDFGIYSAVAGFIAMFAVLSNSLTSAISRFITFEMGRGNIENMYKIFSVSLIVQLIISGIIVLLAETVGVWFLNTQMNIPAERMIAANWIFQFAVLTFVVNLISIPYNASIVAHERMKAFAYVGLCQAVGVLLIAFLIKWSPIDRLIFYGLLMMLIAVFVRFLYSWYCKRNFEECHFRWVWEKKMLKQILGFAGWNFIGASSGVLRDQGVNVLLNIFCGPSVNAARGIATQVNSAVLSFTNNFMLALNPQITKSYANGDREYLIKLVFQGAKFSFFLLLFLSLPILIETHMILLLWLKTIPDYTVVFVRLMLLYVMIESISFTMVTLMLATGKIRNYQLLVGGCQMLNFPLAYILLKYGYTPEITVAIAIVLAIGCLIFRLYMLKRMVGFPALLFIRRVILNVIIVFLLSSIVPVYVVSVFDEGIIRLLGTIVVSLLSSGLMIFLIGCSHNERIFMMHKVKQFFSKK